MTATLVAGVIAAAQAVFLLVLLLLIAVRRGWDHSRRVALATQRAALVGPLRDWLVADGAARDVVSVLVRLPSASTVTAASLLMRTVVPAERRPELAALLRAEPRLQQSVRNATSRWWWRRIEAARALSVVATPDDRATVQRLLDDPQPEVAVSAVACMPLVADKRMIDRELDRYATLTPMMRQYLLATLRDLPRLVEPALVGRLRADAEPRALAERVRLAALLELPRALEASVALSAHEHPEVRAAVAFALRHLPREASLQRLALLLTDGVPAVREEAAASLGALASPRAVAVLEAATRDTDWKVRRRAGLALAQLGDTGREAVRSLRTDPDRYVSSMATIVSGLSEGALLELTEN